MKLHFSVTDTAGDITIDIKKWRKPPKKFRDGYCCYLPPTRLYNIKEYWIDTDVYQGITKNRSIIRSINIDYDMRLEEWIQEAIEFRRDCVLKDILNEKKEGSQKN